MTAAMIEGHAEGQDAPSRSSRFRRDVQGMRALAVLLVVAFHSGLPLDGGFVGVDVFFVISGYVITGLIATEVQRLGRFRFGHFYRRRMRRLIPALALSSIVTLTLAALLLSPIGAAQTTSGSAAVAATLFSANGYFFISTGGYFQPDSAANPFLHTWSLSVEEQFYLAFPIFLLFVLWLARKTSRLVAMIVIVFGLAGSLLLSIVFTYGHISHVPGTLIFDNYPERQRAFAFYATPLRAWEFALGCLVALLPAHRLRESKLWQPLGLALIVGAAVFLNEGDPFPGYLALLPTVGCSFALLGQSKGGLVHTALSSPPAGWIGDRSYSWYLWHWPIIVLATNWFPGNRVASLLAGAGALLPAALAYRYVERPIHRGEWPHSRKKLGALILVCLLVPIGAGLGVRQVAMVGWGKQDLQQLRAEVAPEHLDTTSGCAQVTPLGDPARAPCHWEAAGSSGEILLIGDSNAGHFTEPVLEVSRKLGYGLTVATSGGCPFLIRSSYFTSACRDFVEGSLREILEGPRRYDLVIISNASLGYLVGPLGSSFGHDEDARTSGWAESMGKLVSAVKRVSPVLVIGAVPQFYRPKLPDCLAPTFWLPVRSGCGIIPEDSPVRIMRAALIAKERATVLASGQRYFDTGHVLCRPDKGCSAFVGGEDLYRDGAHLSVEGSEIFTRPLLREVQMVLGDTGTASP